MKKLTVRPTEAPMSLKSTTNSSRNDPNLAPRVMFDFLFDPLCGWCYGAAPAVAALRKVFPIRFALHPIGLFHGEDAGQMEARMVGYIRQADWRIREMTGQVFSDAYYDKIVQPGAPLDSAPATRAILAAEAGASGRGLDLLEALQHARFVEARDIMDPRVIAEAGGKTPAVGDAGIDARIDDSRRLLARYDMDGVPGLVMRGIGDWEGQLLQPIPNHLLYDKKEAVAFVRGKLKALE
jgi:putative protein-disulfide isomerase